MLAAAEPGGSTRGRFRDRRDAGQYLARQLQDYAGRSDVVVLGLPRGGVPVAAEVARELRVPLDVFLVRKVGLPGHEEFAMGAIASGGTVMINEDVTQTYGVGEKAVRDMVAREQRELERRERQYRGEVPLPSLDGRTVILVDDGLATGSSMRAAVQAVKQHRPRETIVAVPVAPLETCEMLANEVTRVVCGATPEPFYAVGLWYEDFSQTTDAEVNELLEELRTAHGDKGQTAQ